MMGLTSSQAHDRLKQYGPNSVPDKKPTFLKRFAKWLFSPISLMLLAAATLSGVNHSAFDAYFILFLTALNGVISFWQEGKANQAVETLKSKLVVTVSVLRDNQWQRVDSTQIVPGDEIRLEVGDLIPADGQLISMSNLSVNEAAITGESLPRPKKLGDTLLAGSFVTTGAANVQITETGARTSYGKAITSIEKATKRSFLEQDILRISYLLSAASLICIVLLTVVLSLQHFPISNLLLLDLSLLIAGVPVSLPTVMSIIISLGVVELSKKNVIVRQLSALQNLANVDLLLTDKTGTLTQNSISVDKTIIYQKKMTEEQFLTIASSTATNDRDPIDQALHSARRPGHELALVKSIPADSIRKRSTVQLKIDGAVKTVSVGAPQVVLHLCTLTAEQRTQATADIESTAKRGYRTLAVAIADGAVEDNMALLGLVCLADPLRPESAATIAELGTEGVAVKILTGDHLSITQTIAQRLHLSGEIVPARQLAHSHGVAYDQKWWQTKSGFAEVLPTDKFRLVEMAKKYYVVGVTGDGVNDLPAISEADVGIAVSNAVDALKSSADVVIARPGIEVIEDALTEARKIFERLYSYSVYRISESYRLIITIAVLGLTIHTYPVTPLQIILLAFLNDLPIISLAVNRVKTAHKPAQSRSKRKLYRGLLHGNVGVASSLLMFYLLRYGLHLPLPIVQTAFFLKLTVSGHMLIYVAHTDEPWYKYLPSKQVIWATSITQVVATGIALSGWFMAPLSIGLIALVWVWSFGWMQVSDMLKVLIPKK